MRGLSTFIAAVSLLLIAFASGCSSLDKSSPPPRVAVPPADGRSMVVEGPDQKPLPRQPTAEDLARPLFDDEPLVSQHPPEQHAYVEAYARVGRPRIVVFVNRTLDGQVIPVNASDPLVSVDSRVKTNGNVNIESRDNNGKFQSNGPSDVRVTTDVYLHPGQYDEASARSIDYEAMETILSDWLSANGKVAIVSPIMARQKLSDQQVKDLQNGRPQVLAEAARQLDADIIVQAQAHPTRQTQYGLEFRMIVEAISVKGGESIARAVVDIPPPLDKPQISKYTRFLARKLMDGMTSSWESFAGPPRAAIDETPPAVPQEPVRPGVVPAPDAPPGPAAVTPPAPQPQPAPADRITPSDNATTPAPTLPPASRPSSATGTGEFGPG